MAGFNKDSFTLDGVELDTLPAAKGMSSATLIESAPSASVAPAALMMVLAASAVGGVLGAMIIGYVRRWQPSQPTLLG
jgi:hypothetical protein